MNEPFRRADGTVVPDKYVGGWGAGRYELSDAAKESVDKYERENQRRENLMKLVAEILAKKGVRMFTSACGCCGGVTFSLEVDGELICDEESEWDFDNFPKKEDAA